MTFISRLQYLVSEGFTVYAVVARSRLGGWFLRAGFYDQEGNCDWLKANYIDRQVFERDLAQAMEYVTEELS